MELGEYINYYNLDVFGSVDEEEDDVDDVQSSSGAVNGND